MEAIENVIYLARCAINGEKPDKSLVAGMNLEHLYQAADRHMLAGIIAIALESAGVREKAFTQAMGMAIRRSAMFDAERAVVLQALEEAGIWYMPLKGSILKEYYPTIGMRQMSDVDVLFDASRSADVRRIMERLGFTTAMYIHGSYNHDIYFKEPIFNFEMHRALFSPTAGKALSDYYLNIKDRLLKDEGNACGYHFTDEDFYIYLTAHEYKHYSHSGTGLRTILDTYVFLKRFDGKLDWQHIHDTLEALGIADFEKQNRSLALQLFGGQALTPEDEAMLQYIVSSSTYGTLQKYVENGVKELGGSRRGKLKYLMFRVFMPVENVASGYPFFYRHKILLPVLYIWRVLRALTIRRSMLKAELKVLKKHKD